MENFSSEKTSASLVPWSSKEVCVPKEFTDLFTKSPDDACLFEMFLNAVGGKDLLEGINSSSNSSVLLSIFQTAIMPEMKKLELTFDPEDHVFLKFEDPYSVAKMRLQVQENIRLRSDNQVAKTGQIFNLNEADAKKFESDFVSLVNQYNGLSGKGKTVLCYNFLSFTTQEGTTHESH